LCLLETDFRKTISQNLHTPCTLPRMLRYLLPLSQFCGLHSAAVFSMPCKQSHNNRILFGFDVRGCFYARFRPTSEKRFRKIGIHSARCLACRDTCCPCQSNPRPSSPCQVKDGCNFNSCLPVSSMSEKRSVPRRCAFNTFIATRILTHWASLCVIYMHALPNPGCFAIYAVPQQSDHAFHFCRKIKTRPYSVTVKMYPICMTLPSAEEQACQMWLGSPRAHTEKMVGSNSKRPRVGPANTSAADKHAKTPWMLAKCYLRRAPLFGV